MMYEKYHVRHYANFSVPQGYTLGPIVFVYILPIKVLHAGFVSVTLLLPQQ